MPFPIQQRKAIERGRKAGILYLIFGAAWLGLWTAALVTSAGGRLLWWNLGLGVAWLGAGAYELLQYRRRMAKLSEQNELDAANPPLDDASH